MTWFVEPTNAGPIKIGWAGTARLELWRINGPVDPGLEGPCTATSSGAAWAIGSANVRNNDNDFFVTGTRTDSFGYRGVGTITDTGGSIWNYEFHFRGTIDRNGTFRLTAPWQFVLAGQR